ncbi:MAG: hypothetical protein BroJett011_50100 [Chloroflexota bacterium]|nr:MAG: hypothetical protein BroJett011_50100 [Chloroflexota bacterium]
MARICVKKKWYEQVEPSTFSEEEFETRVAVHAPSVYPFYHVLPFKKPLRTPDDTVETGVSRVIPDLVFIAKDYSEWWIVEVEMAYHNFNSHVKPQIVKLLNAEYSVEEVDFLCSKYDFLDRTSMMRLVGNSSTRVLVIINQNKPEWARYWTRNVVFATFELFRSNDNYEVFRVNGQYPSVLIDRLSTCTFHSLVPRLLGIDEPSKLKIGRNNIIKLLFNNCVTEWRRIKEGKQIWLTAVNRDPLNSRHQYSIYRQNDGQLVLQREWATESEDRYVD